LKFKVFSLRLGIWRFKIGRSGFSILRSRATAEDGRTNHAGLSVHEKGFTLIEIIILIVMAGIIIPVIVVPFATGIRGSNKPEMVTTAMYLAHYKMEEFMKYRYLNSALNPTAMTSYADISGFSGYQWQWEIYYVEDSSFNVVGDGIQATNHRGYKRILVRVKDPMTDTYEIYSVVTFFP
jgi:Tfp pilus assembly protein PilE